MDAERERALTLAHEAETKDSPGRVGDVIERARRYLNFLLDEPDDKPVTAPSENGARGF